MLKNTVNSLGKIPELRDRFTVQVINGVITLIQWGKRLDGSDEQVDFGDDKIKCLISLADAGSKIENKIGGLSGLENGF